MHVDGLFFIWLIVNVGMGMVHYNLTDYKGTSIFSYSILALGIGLSTLALNWALINLTEPAKNIIETICP